MYGRRIFVLAFVLLAFIACFSVDVADAAPGGHGGNFNPMTIMAAALVAKMLQSK